MPTQAEIDALHQSLIDKAVAIKLNAALAVQKSIEEQQAQDAKELRKAQLYAPLTADKITYTNEPQRMSALIEETADDVLYQTKLQDEYNAKIAKRTGEFDAERDRRLYRADELLLLYYTNNPTP